MSILKLPNVGDTATLNVARCEVVEGESGEQVMFVAANGDVLYLPRTSADRQLLRCGFGDDASTGLEYGNVSGATLVFSRAPNPKKGFKPFWNIDRGSPKSNGKPPESAKPAPPKVVPGGEEDETGAPPVEEKEAIELRAYRKCVKWYLKEIVPLMDAAEVGTTPESVGVGIATIYIALKDKLK